MNPDANHLNCLLCGSKQLKDFDRLNGRQIRALWRERGTEFPAEALKGISDSTDVILWECCGCGFKFFDPSLAGNGLFYQLLESADYYSTGRPEFQRTLEFAAKNRLTTVLDVGCGAGAFLDQARQAGLQTFGLELNVAAAEKARAKGHHIFDRLLHEIPTTACPGGFDLITLFQVLEHVSDPVAVVKDAAAHLKPGGFVAVAVPSEVGVLRLIPLDPAQWPPHHISRWRLEDFKTLAAKTRLSPVKAGGDVLLGSRIEQVIQSQRQMEAVIGKRPPGKAPAWPHWLSWLYRKTGMKHFFPHRGDSIYVFLLKT